MPTPPAGPLSRRALLGALARAAVAVAVAPGLLPRPALAAMRPGVPHPEPRPGITAARVLPAAEVPEKYRDAYEAAREVPQILDGLFCHCDCAAHRGLRSLLSCFESKMPQSCGICTGSARLARRLHARGRTLAEIRVEVDKTYGGGHARH